MTLQIIHIIKPLSIGSSNRSINFSYKFFAVKSNWAEVLSSPAGVTINHQSTNFKGLSLPWLEWLLVSGDQFKIDGYKIQHGSFPRARSRSGMAIMVEKGSWVVPQGFAPFNANNNFVTLTLHKLATDTKFRAKLSGVLKTVGRFGSGGGLSSSELSLLSSLDL